MPFDIICLIIFSWGLVFTAYKILPGKFSLKNETDFFNCSGRIQYTGLSGFNVLTSSLTYLNFRISCVPLLFTQRFFKKFNKKNLI